VVTNIRSDLNGDSVRGDSKPDLQRYGATAIEGVYYPMDSFFKSEGRTPTTLPTLHFSMGWLLMCGYPIIFTLSDSESISFGFSDPQVE
jgi:hypothetical protein